MAHAYLVDGVRTPIGRYGGALATVRPDDLAAHVLRAAGGAVTTPAADPQVGENTCPDCAGTGKKDGRACRTCAGSGIVEEVVGDA